MFLLGMIVMKWKNAFYQFYNKFAGPGSFKMP